MSKMQIKFDAPEEIKKMIEGYAAEEGSSQKQAICDLIKTGWITKHQDILSQELMTNLRTVMDSVSQADMRAREDSLDAVTQDISDQMIAVKAVLVTCMLMMGQGDIELIKAKYEQALKIVLDMD